MCLSIFVFSTIKSSSTWGYNIPKGRRHKELGLESGEVKRLARLIDFAGWCFKNLYSENTNEFLFWRDEKKF